MNKTLLALTLLALLFTFGLSVHHDSDSNSVSDDSDDNTFNHEEEPLMGGWTPVDVNDIQVYENALNYLRSQTNDLPQGSQIIKISRQVVAGLNYKFLFKEGSKFR